MCMEEDGLLKYELIAIIKSAGRLNHTPYTGRTYTNVMTSLFLNNTSQTASCETQYTSA